MGIARAGALSWRIESINRTAALRNRQDAKSAKLRQGILKWTDSS
jgi:hypothetical protein